MLPDIPSVAEGGVPGFEMVGSYGLLGPAGMSPAVIAALNRDLVQILALADVQQKLALDGADAPQLSPEQFRDAIVNEIDKVAKLVKESGLKLD